jgi:hypothetical protein
MRDTVLGVKVSTPMFHRKEYVAVLPSAEQGVQGVGTPSYISRPAVPYVALMPEPPHLSAQCSPPQPGEHTVERCKQQQHEVDVIAQ